MASRDAFREEPLARFFGFVAARQRAWYRRVVLAGSPPWSEDPTIRERRFTNVYRILDPGTQYAVGSILDRSAPAADRAFNVMLYRLVGRAATHEHVGFQRLDDFDVAAFEAALRSRRDAGGPVFTGAYLVAGYAGMGGSDKVENVARLFGRVRDRFDGFWAEVGAASEPADVYGAIRSLPGFGNFLAYQVLVDLLYPLPGHDGASLLPFSQNAWAAAGPGAKRGLGVLLADASDCAELDAMRWIHRNRRAEFDRIDVDFVRLRDADGDPIDLSLADVQNCCCEFYKWETLRVGEGRTRRLFRPHERRSVEELRAVYAGYPISLECEDYTVGPDS